MRRMWMEYGGARLLMLATLFAGLAGGAARADDYAVDYDPPGRVARVNLLDGRGEIQPAGSDDWIGDLLNRPLAGGDKLWIDERSRAEMHIGSTAVRLGAGTAVQVLVVDDRNVRLRLTSGSLSLRIRGLDSDDHFDIETPSGQVAIEQPGGYRLDVDERDEQTHVAVWSGQAAVTGRFGTGLVHGDEGAELYGGDDPAVELTSPGDTDELDAWAEQRDAREDRSAAAHYVSRELVGYEELDDYGDWVDDPEFGVVWVPQNVGPDWAPYRYGSWSWITPWGWTWVDSAPWGFAPCHYGRWVHGRRGWAWAPGSRDERRPVYAPALVAWHDGHDPDRDHAPRVGWVPLGYNEVYVPAYRASRDYLRAVNTSNTRLRHGEVERYFDAQQRSTVPPHRYANEAVPGAVTVVTRDAFTGARPVEHNRVQPAPAEMNRGPFTVRAPNIHPLPRVETPALPEAPQPMRTEHPVFDRPVMPVQTPQWPAQRREPVAPQAVPRQAPVWMAPAPRERGAVAAPLPAQRSAPPAATPAAPAQPRADRGERRYDRGPGPRNRD